MQDVLDGIQIVPLTKEKIADDKLDHIVWIEESEPVVAIQKMVKALETKPFNCAVWANADAGENPAWREDVRAWRDQSAADPENVHYIQSDRQHASAGNVFPDLHAQFEKAQGKKPPAVLKQHVERRLKTIFDALGDVEAGFQVRRGLCRQVIDGHTDGWHGGVKNWRLLEAVGLMTYLFSNADAVIRSDGEWVVSRTKDVTAYQAPLNSMVLLSSLRWDWRAIVHGEPFLPMSQPKQTRTVMVYDVYRHEK